MTDAAIVAALDALRAELAAVRRLVSALRPPPAPGPRELGASTARLLSCLARLLGESVFSAQDVRRLAHLDGELGALLGTASVRDVGTRLRHARRRPGDGPFRVRRVGRDEHGSLWVVLATDCRHIQAKAGHGAAGSASSRHDTRR